MIREAINIVENMADFRLKELAIDIDIMLKKAPKYKKELKFIKDDLKYFMSESIEEGFMKFLKKFMKSYEVTKDSPILDDINYLVTIINQAIESVDLDVRLGNIPNDSNELETIRIRLVQLQRHIEKDA